MASNAGLQLNYLPKLASLINNILTPDCFHQSRNYYPPGYQLIHCLITKANKFDTIHLDGQMKGMIVNNREGVAVPLASRGRQMSSLNRNELLDANRQVQPDQFEMAYSLNI